MNFYKSQTIKYKYRYDPVPGTGTKTYNRVRFMRRMKTTQERSINCLHYSEGIHIRGKRKHKILIDSWYDVRRERHKNWKEFRKKQYKG